jgi:hypothetical protein
VIITTTRRIINHLLSPLVYSLPPWLGTVKKNLPPFSASPIVFLSGAWLWDCVIRRRLSIPPLCGRFKDGSCTEDTSVASAYLGNTPQLACGLGRLGEVRRSMYYRNPIKIMWTTQLNDSIFSRLSVSLGTSAQLYKSDFVFRFYVHGDTFDNPSELFFFLSARGTVFGALYVYGLFLFSLLVVWLLTSCSRSLFVVRKK